MEPLLARAPRAARRAGHRGAHLEAPDPQRLVPGRRRGRARAQHGADPARWPAARSRCARESSSSTPSIRSCGRRPGWPATTATMRGSPTTSSSWSTRPSLAEGTCPTLPGTVRRIQRMLDRLVAVEARIAGEPTDRGAARQPRHARRTPRARGAPLPAGVPVRPARARHPSAPGARPLLDLVILPRRPAASARGLRARSGPTRARRCWSTRLALRRRGGRGARGRRRRVELAMRYGEPVARARRSTALRRAPACDRMVVVPLYPAVRGVEHRLDARGRLPDAAARVEHAGARGGAAVLRRPALHRRVRRGRRAGARGARARSRAVSASTACPNGTCARATPAAHTAWPRPTAATDRRRQPQLLPRPVLRHRARPGRPARASPPPRLQRRFQSRLGRDAVDPAVHRRGDPRAARAAGCKRLAVFCPAFVADCLETLEEIGIRAASSSRARAARSSLWCRRSTPPGLGRRGGGSRARRRGPGSGPGAGVSLSPRRAGGSP